MTEASSFASLGERFDAFADETARGLGVPGAAAGFVLGLGEHCWTHGVTSLDHPMPVDEGTLFQIGSTTKTYTATAVMRLVEEGRVSLSRPLRDYIPDLRLRDPRANDESCLWHCFTHTGGWDGDHFLDTGWGDDALERLVASMSSLEQLTVPGSVFAYNNAGYSLAGRVVERVTGQPIEAALHELLLDPLGLRESLFHPTDQRLMVSRFASGHVPRPDGPRVNPLWTLPRSCNAAGGLVSSVRDQLAYARFQLGDGAGIVSAGTLAGMRAAQHTAIAPGQVGISWMLEEVGGVTTVSHGGLSAGQQSAFLLVPERAFAVVVLTNFSGGGLLSRELVDWVLREALGVRRRPLAELPEVTRDLEQYAGAYASRMLTAHLRVEGDRLVIHPAFQRPPLGGPPPPAPPPPAVLRMVERDRGVIVTGPQAGRRFDFLRDDAGKIVWFRWADRLFRPVNDAGSLG